MVDKNYQYELSKTAGLIDIINNSLALAATPTLLFPLQKLVIVTVDETHKTDLDGIMGREGFTYLGEVTTLPEESRFFGILDDTEPTGVTPRKGDSFFDKDHQGIINRDTANWRPGRSPAYANMFEDNGTGSAITNTNTFKGWVSAGAGIVDQKGRATFSSNATADRLLIGAGGKGDYLLNFSVSFLNSAGDMVIGAIHKNDAIQHRMKTRQLGNSVDYVNMTGGGIVSLAATDYVDLRFRSETASTVTVNFASLSISRLARNP